MKRAAAVKKGDPETFEDLKAGKITTGAAEKKVKEKRKASKAKAGTKTP